MRLSSRVNTGVSDSFRMHTADTSLSLPASSEHGATSSARSTHGYLARELKDMILGQLDGPSLAACTLLSRQDDWHVAARDYLFRKVVIHDILKDHSHNLSAFRGFLESGPSLHTFQYTKEFVLRGEFGNNSEVTSVELSAILSNFPNLVSLKLDKVWLRVAGAVFHDNPRSLDLLQLRSTYIELLVDTKEEPITAQCSLTEFLSGFSSVKTLDLHIVEFTWHSVLEQESEDGEPAAHLLYLSGAEGRKLPPTYSIEDLSIVRSSEKPYMFLAEFFKRSVASRHVRQLASSRPTDLRFFADFVKTMTLNLRHLKISHRLGDNIKTVNLSSCGVLTSLHLSMYLHGVGHRAPQIDNTIRVTATLNTALVSPPTTSQLTFEFVVSRSFARHDKLVFLRGLNLDWESLDKGLSTRRNLTKVVFIFRDARAFACIPQEPQGLESEVEEVKERVPRLHARGVLMFECVEGI